MRRQEKSVLMNSSRSAVENTSSSEGGSPHSFSLIRGVPDKRTGADGV